MDPRLAYFAGPWNLARDIPTQGHFQGTAHFSPDPSSPDPALLYLEQGHLTLSNHAPFEASRQYRYVFYPDRLEILFHPQSPPNLFLTLPFPPHPPTFPLHLTDHHLCIDDHYTMAFDLLSPTTFTTHCRVLGPNKNYTLLSTYTRSPHAQLSHS